MNIMTSTSEIYHQPLAKNHTSTKGVHKQDVRTRHDQRSTDGPAPNARYLLAVHVRNDVEQQFRRLQQKRKVRAMDHEGKFTALQQSDVSDLISNYHVMSGMT